MKRRVLMLISTRSGYERELIRGILAFAETQPNWEVRHEDPWQCEPAAVASSWKPDGVICDIEDDAVLKSLRRLSIPVMDVGYRDMRAAPPAVRQDDRLVGRIAGEYLLARGLRCFGFVGCGQHAFSLERQAGFQQAVEQRGGRLSVLVLSSDQSIKARTNGWALRRKQLADWLRAQPKPVGVLAYYDTVGVAILELCRHEQIPVPEQVAVVGVEDDDLLCTTSDPPLSSVRVPNEQIGYCTAEQMQRALSGARLRTVLLPPIGIVTRGSSDLIATEDAVVATALRFIHANYNRPIGMESVLDHVTVSLSQLERRFRAAIGRTPSQEIRRLRIDRAQQLLAGSQFNVTQIGGMCGFGTPGRFTTAFRHATGKSPREYRRGMAALGSATPKNTK